jgi:DNA-binding beta-propeller fold protein YncE
VPVGRAPVGIVITHDGKYVLNTNSARFRADADSAQTITVIDRANAVNGEAAIVDSIEAGVFPRQLSLSQDGRTIFVTNYLSNTLELIKCRVFD